MLKKLTTPHPCSCFDQCVSAITDPLEGPYARTFILCKQNLPSPFLHFYNCYRYDPRWRCVELDCQHEAMIEQPEALAPQIPDTRE